MLSVQTPLSRLDSKDFLCQLHITQVSPPDYRLIRILLKQIASYEDGIVVVRSWLLSHSVQFSLGDAYLHLPVVTRENPGRNDEDYYCGLLAFGDVVTEKA